MMVATRAKSDFDERLPQVFVPSAILPSQYFSARRRVRSAEERLVAAILEDAIAVYSKNRQPKTRKGRRLLNETERWFLSSDRTWVFSYLRVCEALDLDPYCIRRALHIPRTGLPDVAPRPEPCHVIPMQYARGAA